MIRRLNYCPLWGSLFGDDAVASVARAIGVAPSVAHGWASGDYRPDVGRMSEGQLRELARFTIPSEAAGEVADVSTVEAARVGRMVIWLARQRAAAEGEL